MIMLGEYPVIDLPQNWARSCKYALTGKYGRADNLLGAEDRVSYSHTPRRTYQYSVMARNAAERMNLDTIVRQALAVKKCAVPIWAKARYDFIRAGLVFTFTGTPPAVGTNWLLYSAAAGVSVLTVSEVADQLVTFEVVADSNGGDGLHGGDLVPLLCGYIQKPKGSLIGGDAGKLSLSFVQNDFVKGSGGVVVAPDKPEKEKQYVLYSTGAQYLNTNIIPLTTQDYDLYGRYTQIKSYSQIMGCARSSYGDRAYIAVYRHDGGFDYPRYDAVNHPNDIYGMGDTNFHLWSKKGTTLGIDNSFIDRGSYGAFGSMPSLYLYTYNNNYAVDDDKCYFGASFFKVWSNASRTLLNADMRAVPGGSQLYGAPSVAQENCMYCLVRGTYHYNLGSGVFGIEEVSS